MKKLLAFALTFCLMISLSVPALAAGSGLGNFQKTDTYTGQFADVPAGHWAAPSVKLCYEYGLKVCFNRFNLEGILRWLKRSSWRIASTRSIPQVKVPFPTESLVPALCGLCRGQRHHCCRGLSELYSQGDPCADGPDFYNALPASELAPSTVSLPSLMCPLLRPMLRP